MSSGGIASHWMNTNRSITYEPLVGYGNAKGLFSLEFSSLIIYNTLRTSLEDPVQFGAWSSLIHGPMSRGVKASSREFSSVRSSAKILTAVGTRLAKLWKILPNLSDLARKK